MRNRHRYLLVHSSREFESSFPPVTITSRLLISFEPRLVSCDQFKALGKWLDPFQRIHVHMICSSLAEAHDEHSMAGPGPSETGDFNHLADHRRAKGANDLFFNHGEQSDVLLFFAVTNTEAIKAYCLRAGEGHLVVPSNREQHFRKELAKLGYI